MVSMITYLDNLVFAHPGNVSTFYQQFCYINSLTDVGAGGFIGTGIIILIGVVLFMMMKSYSFERAFAVSAMITGVLGVLLSIMGTSGGCSLVNNYVVTICIVLAVVGVLLLMKEASQYES